MHWRKYVHCSTIFLDAFNQVHILSSGSNVSVPVSEQNVHLLFFNSHHRKFYSMAYSSAENHDRSMIAIGSTSKLEFHLVWGHRFVMHQVLFQLVIDVHRNDIKCSFSRNIKLPSSQSILIEYETSLAMTTITIRKC